MVLAITAKLIVTFAVLTYVGLVLTGYATEGSHYQPRLDICAPCGSALRLLIWIGVSILHLLLTFVNSVLNQLFAASGDLAAWTVAKSSPEIERKLRQRFL
jgi:hypothetical protein